MTSESKERKIYTLVKDWVELHKDEQFTLDQVCRDLQINERENRRSATVVLNRLAQLGRLEKSQVYKSSIYRYITSEYKTIDWINASDKEFIEVTWPWGHEDNSRFGFDGAVKIVPGDIVVIAGGSNFGKTAFCLNVLWDNMDTYPCFLMGNEYEAGRFKRRVKHMTWANPLNEVGKPKFELAERREQWKDIIKPNHINIIDWIMMSDNFYQIGAIIDGIKSKLQNGIALISLQKSPGKDLGRGGAFSVDLASLYLSIDHERMTVIKAKEWNGHNPNNEIYGFKLVQSGTLFHNIHELQKCYQCGTTGKYRGQECSLCFGSGYIDKKP